MKKLFIYGLLLLALSWGCTSASKEIRENSHEHTHDHSHEGHDHDHEGHDHEHEDEDHEHEGHSHDGEITFTKAQAEASGLKTLTVNPGQIEQVIKASGQLLPPSGDEITIPASTNGIVTFSRAAGNAGQAIRAGEPLAVVSSRHMLDGDPMQKVEAAYGIAEKEYQRAEALIKDKLISEKQYNEIKLTYENARIAHEASAGKTTAKGTNIVSPASGYLKSRIVGEGEYVEAGQPLFTITQNRKLQLRADVPESHYKDLQSITSANFKTPYSDSLYRLADLNGRLVSYGKTASGSYAIPVYFEFDNIGEIFPGSYTDVFLIARPLREVLTVPVSALTEEQGLYFLYIQAHEESYIKREVRTGVSDGQSIEITSGLKAGETVVTHGAYHIRLSSVSASIPHGHEH